MKDLLEGTTLRQRARAAIADEHLSEALSQATDRLTNLKLIGSSALENYEELRDAGRYIRGRVVANLSQVLGTLTDNVEASGGKVFFAKDGSEAAEYVSRVAVNAGARTVVKSKSMASEEIHLNDALGNLGIQAIETDLGEWIIQLAHQTPSHIIAPAIHLTARDVSDIFNKITEGDLSDVPAELCAFAREQLRQKFLESDVGVSGVNFGIAETGTIAIVTNEGNGRVVTSLPRVHIAIMGRERVVETWEQFDVMLALLPRAATGQQITTYVNMVTGPRRPGETDGPDEFHLVILDNGRSDILGTEFQEILHCIRCGACLNVCPVFRQIGGHGYGWVYSGPVGAVLTPLLNRAEEAGELQDASSLCGACWEACPVKIPLQDLLLGLRRKKAEDAGGIQRAMWRGWAATWSRPRAYKESVRSAATMSKIVPEQFAPKGWRAGRKIPRAPKGTPSFRSWFESGEK